MSEPADHPDIIGLPPLIVGGVVLVGCVGQWLTPLALPLPRWSWIPGVAIMLAGFLMASWARRIQTRAGTNVNPMLPTTAIVDGGPYAFSRNPMYLSLLLIHLGVMVALRSVWLLFGLPVTFVLLHVGVVLREERYLDAKFGETYRSYRARVRRYL